MFFKQISCFRAFKLSIFISNITMDFHNLKFLILFCLVVLIRRNKNLYSLINWQDKIKISNANVPAYSWIKYLYPINICYNIFIFNEFGISFRLCSIQELLKYVTFSVFRCKSIQWISLDLYASRFIYYILFRFIV